MQAVGRLIAIDGQAVERRQLVGILGAVDIHVHIGAFCHLKGIFELKSVASGHGQCSQQLIHVGLLVLNFYMHFGLEQTKISP